MFILILFITLPSTLLNVVEYDGIDTFEECVELGRWEQERILGIYENGTRVTFACKEASF